MPKIKIVKKITPQQYYLYKPNGGGVEKKNQKIHLRQESDNEGDPEQTVTNFIGRTPRSEEKDYDVPEIDFINARNSLQPLNVNGRGLALNEDDNIYTLGNNNAGIDENHGD